MALAPRRLAASLVAAASLSAMGASLPALASGAADPIVEQSAPTLLAPANDKTTPIKDVVLQWSKVPYATNYQVQISPNGDWTNNKVDLPNSGLTVAPLYEVPISLPHDEYYWRVRGVDAGGHTAWSSSRQFLHDWATPLTILKAPTSTDPSISWAPVAEASLYRVRLSDDPTFGSQDTHVCWTAGTSLTPYSLLSSTETLAAGDCFTQFDPKDGTTYYWEVVAYDDSTAPVITSDNAPDTTFECGQAQPECDAASVGAAGSFTWKSPAAGASAPASAPVNGLATTWHVDSLPGTACDVNTACPTTPTFSWDAVSGANYYHVFVFRDPYGTNVYRAYSTDWPSLTPREDYQDAQAGHAYYWQVVAYACGSDTVACTGDDTAKTFVGSSQIASFGKRSDAPVLRSPGAGSTVHTPFVTFRWDDYLASSNQSTFDAANYHLQISTTKSFDTPVTDVSTIDMTRWTDPSQTLKDGVYFWRVQAIDESGNPLTWSAARTFTFDGAPPQFRLTSKNGLNVARNIHVRASEADIVGTVSSRTVKVFAVSTKKAIAGRWDRTGAAAWTFNPAGTLVPGESYALQVSGLRDQSGNAAIASSRTVRTSTSVDDRSPAIHYSSSWSRASSSNAQHGTYSVGTAGSATVTVVGSQIAVYGCKGPSLGTAVVHVDGKRVATAHEHQNFSQCGVLVWRGPVSSAKPHTLQFTQSSGTVALDAVKLA